MGNTTLAEPKTSLSNPAKGRKKRLYASPVKRVFSEDTEEAIGWVYQWNTGEQVKIMHKKHKRYFAYKLRRKKQS